MVGRRLGIFRVREEEGGVVCRRLGCHVGTREDEVENSSRILGGDGTGQGESVTSGDLKFFYLLRKVGRWRVKGDEGLG